MKFEVVIEEQPNIEGLTYDEALSFGHGSVFTSTNPEYKYWVVVSNSKNMKGLFNLDKLTMYHDWGVYKELGFNLVKQDTTLTLTIE